ncbi:hypothetical protein RugamoR64_48660 [Duganella rhizosphaerae]|uniref:hypothetical protein n=1 Tax=Duganella rhizosphaerae TaxID=2885763 RepID=UPI0030E7F0AA
MPVDSQALRAADAQASRQNPQGNAMEDVQPCPQQKPPRKITIYLTGRDGAYADVPFELAVDDRTISAPGARTPPDGKIEYEVADGSSKGELRVWFDEHAQPEVYPLVLKELEPASGSVGLAERVRARGVHPGPDGKLSEVHVRELERLLGLPETGAPDGAWQAAVTSLHGS